MPASRIAFALADLKSEIADLMPPDSDIVVVLRVERAAFNRVGHELANHSNMPNAKPDAVKFLTFSGVRIEAIDPEPTSG